MKLLNEKQAIWSYVCLGMGSDTIGFLVRERNCDSYIFRLFEGLFKPTRATRVTFLKSRMMLLFLLLLLDARGYYLGFMLFDCL
jgi:hypothetical protein